MIATFFTKSNPTHYVFASIYLLGLFVVNLNYNIFNFLIGSLALLLLLLAVLLSKFIISKNSLTKKKQLWNYSYMFFSRAIYAASFSF